MGTTMWGRLQPDTQLDNLNIYKDDIVDGDLQFAESLGIVNAGPYSDGEVVGGSLTTFLASTSTPFTGVHEDYFVVITGSSNGNDGAYQIDSIDSSGQVTLATALAAAESGMSFKIYRNPSLEDDINYAITQISNIIGDTGSGKNWYNILPYGFDPSDTDGSNTKNEKIDLSVLAADWYGSKTKIYRNLIFNNEAVSSGDTAAVIETTVAYATPANRTGGSAGALPIFNSVANAGSYYDEGGINAVTKVNIIDMTTGDEFLNAAGYVVFGKLHDGADYHPSALGDGSAVAVVFYQDDGSNGGLGSPYTWAAEDPALVRFEIPRRKNRKDILEHEEDSQFYGSTLGDAETAQDIAQIRDALGIADGDGAGDWDLTNTGNYYPFSELNLSTATIEDIVNKLNEEIGDRTYTLNNVLVDGETITESLDRLDQFIGLGFKTKIIERVSSPILKNTSHTIPFATGSDSGITSYKVDSGNRALYMDIYLNGQLLTPHVDASNPGHYVEVDGGSGTGTTVIFKLTISVSDILTYIIRDDA